MESGKKSEKAVIREDSSIQQPFVIVRELPEDQQQEFSDWLLGITTPVVPEADAFYGEIVLCAYSWDYEIWYDYWIQGEIAPKD